MQPQHPPTYEEVSSDDQAGKMPHRPAESPPVVHQATHVLSQYSREYIQYLREQEHHDHELEADRRFFLHLVQLCILFFSMIIILLVFSLAWIDHYNP